MLAKPLDPAELERGLIAAERLVTMHRRMTSDARRDPLTGAGSRVRLDEDLAALCARVTRYGHTYCVAMIGLAPGGDDGVRRVGAALTQEIRSGDVLYRYGPAQFVVLLPEQGLETANLAATRLRTAVRAGRPGRDGDQRRHRHHGRRARAGGVAGRGGGDAHAGRDAGRRGAARRRRGRRRRCGCWSPTTTPCRG